MQQDNKEIKNKKRKKILTIVLSSVASVLLIITICLLTFLVFIPKVKLNKIEKLIEENELVTLSSTKNSIYFGSYPQTKIKDNTLFSTLTSMASTDLNNWIDYGYYINGKVEGYMYYKDIELDGSKYRGVYFNQYRPYNTCYTDYSSSGVISYKDSRQYNNDYRTKILYWFKYEPIKWNILKIEDNKVLIISDLLLDSQDYNYTDQERYGAVDYQGNKTNNTIHANNYMYSHIRSWLNLTFYETAFNELEKEIIETTTVDNSAKTTAKRRNIYARGSTNDKMFLLSYKEVKKYFSSGEERQAQGSEYAKCQGLEISYNNDMYYWLRSPDYSEDYIAGYVSSRTFNNYQRVYYTNIGVRPVCWINL